MLILFRGTFIGLIVPSPYRADMIDLWGVDFLGVFFCGLGLYRYFGYTMEVKK